MIQRWQLLLLRSDSLDQTPRVEYRQVENDILNYMYIIIIEATHAYIFANTKVKCKLDVFANIYENIVLII